MASSRVLALLGCSTVALLQHFQLASFYRHAMKESDGNWKSDPRDVFSNLEDLALRFYGDTFMGFYYLSVVLSIGSALVYILFHRWIHLANLKPNFSTPFVVMWEYLIFGFGFVPMVANLAEVTFCDSNEDVQRHSSMDCFKSDQITLIVFGFAGISTSLFMAGAVFPALKTERKGIERAAIDDPMFGGIYHLVIIFVIVMVAPMQRPWVGIFLHILAIVHLVYYGGYAELHVASLRMAILLAQMWLFCATQEVQDSDSRGSNMLYAWPVFLVIGYAVMPIKAALAQKMRKSSTT